MREVLEGRGMSKLGFGKYADFDVRHVPEDYLRWLVKTSKESLATYETELARREMDAEASVRVGFKELAKRNHPDQGGSTVAMQELNAAYETLKRSLDD